MSFWGSEFWGADYWSAEYWGTDAPAPDYVQYPNVELTIGPSSVHTYEVIHEQTGTAQIVFGFAALQNYIGGDFSQTGDPSIVFSPDGTQDVTYVEISQTGDVAITFSFSALQYLGLIQVSDANIVFTPSSVQTLGVSTLAHEHLCDVGFVFDPTVLQVWLTRYTGPSAQATAATVAGFDSDNTVVVLSPAQNIGTERFFEFLVYSKDFGWLNNSGKAGMPVWVEVSFNGTPAVSVNLYKSRFVVDYTMGATYTTVHDGLANKNLNVTLKAYEKFPSYALANPLYKDTTVLVRAYDERVI